jgi:hypothetical protein
MKPFLPLKNDGSLWVSAIAPAEGSKPFYRPYIQLIKTKVRFSSSLIGDDSCPANHGVADLEGNSQTISRVINEK